MLGAGGVGRDERQVDLRLLGGGQLDLGLLGRLVEALEGHLVLRQVDRLVALELGREPVHDRLVEVVAAEVVVTRGRLDLEHAVADLEHGHVERAAAEVEDEDRLVGLLVEAVGERGRRRLVDDALDVEPRDAAGVLGGLALVVVEVRGDGDDRAVDGLAEIGLGVRLELLQDHRGDLRRGMLLAARLHARVATGTGDDLVRDDRLLLADLGLLAAHEALDGEDGVGGVGDRLALGHRADEALTGLREGDDGRRGAATLGVLDDGRLAALEDGHARIRRAEIDTDGLGHTQVLLSSWGTEQILVRFAEILAQPDAGGTRRRFAYRLDGRASTSRVAGTLQVQITDKDAAGATTDTCDTTLVSWSARSTKGPAPRVRPPIRPVALSSRP